VHFLLIFKRIKQADNIGMGHFLKDNRRNIKRDTVSCETVRKRKMEPLRQSHPQHFHLQTEHFYVDRSAFRHGLDRNLVFFLFIRADADHTVMPWLTNTASTGMRKYATTIHHVPRPDSTVGTSK
jgi:hypothetical protein